MRAPALLFAALAMPIPTSASEQAPVPIVQPGLPGSAPRVITPEAAIEVADTRSTSDDIAFMQMMIHHHSQALDMTALARTRTTNRELLKMAARISASQDDEMDFMRSWLKSRGVAVASAVDHGHGSTLTMKGMASAEQMAELKAAKGEMFDRMFLELMSAHHAGAVKMVEDLLKKPGAAYDPILFQFTGDVTNEQTAEIKRMAVLRASLANDPRESLRPGFRNAGEAVSNLTLVASLPRPPGFFSPDNPADLPPPKAKKGAKPGADFHAARVGKGEDPEYSERWPLLLFGQTDMAFRDDTLFVGNFHGFNIYRIDSSGVPSQIGSVVCSGGQGDVSVVGNLLISSVEETRSRTDCGSQGISEDISADRFRGIRIFDISDLSRPRQVGQVQTCRGSHTHSVVKGPGNDGKILVYVSGTSSVRKAEELAGCSALASANSSLFRIDIVEIPVANPAAARIVDSPAIFADPRTGDLAGLWRGGNHGEGTQETHVTDQCHDITVFPARGIAAGACSGNGIVLDISNPLAPRRIDAVSDPGFAYWHSATFNNDGSKVIFTDEWGGGLRPRCRSYDPREYGADAIYDLRDGKLIRRSTYKLPAIQAENENCVAHNGSIIPVPGRDIMVQSWYQGGISVFDFTDSANPVEIAYFDRGPVEKASNVLAGYWSSYFYRGRIYATEIARGLDVFALEPSEMLSANEIAAAALASQGATFNPQEQYPVSWPPSPVVARAYADQLRRQQALDPAFDKRLAAALGSADRNARARTRDAALAEQLRELAKESRATPGDSARRTALAQVLDEIAASLG